MGKPSLKTLKILLTVKSAGKWKDFIKFLKYAKDVVDYGKDNLPKLNKEATETKENIKKDGRLIESNDVQEIHKKSNLEIVIDPLSPKEISSTIGSVTKVDFLQFKYMSIVIMNSDLTEIIAFHSNDDWSWIVNEEGVVRAKYGTLWEEDKNAGFHKWGHNDLEWSYVDIVTAIVSHNPKKLAETVKKMAEKHG